MAVTQTYIRRQIMGTLLYSRALMRSAPSRLKQALSFKNYVQDRLLLGRKNRFVHHVYRYQKKIILLLFLLYPFTLAYTFHYVAVKPKQV